MDEVRRGPPDECATDPRALCLLADQNASLAGETLSRRDLTWIGVGCQPPTSDEGWRDAAAALQSFVPEHDPRHADVGMMQVLMSTDVSGTMSEFLAG